ncbi:MAG: hypothetical protein EXR82_01575 [Gammaproteobacteria bacterium]|nr:hypothetical protein [Gammaproteobacteria bacterium]
MSLLTAGPGRAVAEVSFREATDALAAEHPGQCGVLLPDTGAEALAQRDALISAARATLAAHPNVQIRIYKPSAARQGVLRLLGFVRNFSQLNRRMHNKSFTADGAVTIVGGRNVGDEYFDLDPEVNFRDRERLAAGPVVAEVTAGFEAFWTSTWTKPVAARTPGRRDGGSQRPWLCCPTSPGQPDSEANTARVAVGPGPSGFRPAADRRADCRRRGAAARSAGTAGAGGHCPQRDPGGVRRSYPCRAEPD